MANKFGMFLIGGVVGAVAALLAAPRSGAETRAMVADKAGEFAGNAQQWGDSAAAGAQDGGTVQNVDEVFTVQRSHNSFSFSSSH